MEGSNSSLNTSSLQAAAAGTATATATGLADLHSQGSWRSRDNHAQQHQQPIQILKKPQNERFKAAKKQQQLQQQQHEDTDAHSHESHETHESGSSLKRAVVATGGTIPLSPTSKTKGPSSPRNHHRNNKKRDVVVQHPAGHVVEYRFTVGDDDVQEDETQGTLQPNGTVKLSRRRSSGSKTMVAVAVAVEAV